jgi:CHAD domain-containing protein
VLAARLEVVRSALPLAVHDADSDPEHVHRLRVGTRRAAAALRIFGDSLADRALRRARKKLRALRRAAGEARDWDVFLLDLLKRREHLPPSEQPGIDFLVGYAAGQRDAVQAHLVEAGTTHGPLLKDLIDATVAAVRPGGGEPHDLRDLGRDQLGALLKELDWAAAGRLEDFEHLHHVRILGKQLRYAMEVFADCFDAPFREELYPKVEQMQEILGRANDSHVATQRLAILRDRLRQKWPLHWKRYQPGLDGLVRYHRRRLPREREHFVQWWREWETGHSGRLRELLLGPSAVRGQESEVRGQESEVRGQESEVRGLESGVGDVASGGEITRAVMPAKPETPPLTPDPGPL